ncbi:MAG TPA: UDP-N-acetylglucosamine 2-epimerase (non-hydrolyzing) [Candidatus Avacidaminococcus intestinavium]|uniref:UDP-N-acetylglucosamine 2-epimerase (Non-hydrolyzing) n=1 Tax=Candidatus Avacidaminococcus intestinavium TaxID=2840684 RepID=A0A9D1MQH2_9FIRM|nr:UDP-N-acetylglucosamine 2-epimerase (non-hydrolyzing) [Candidatus Avacidaminococcus intestinavium]
MKIITVVGARPQFIKASVVSKAIQEIGGITEIIVHTGQHFDENMSEVFFNDLAIPRPKYKLDVNGGNHGDMTGRMLIEIEKVLLKEKPDLVLVYGDTNSTLAGALAAAKLHIPVAHVEAGVRDFDMRIPEEVNRILTDQVSSILFCPTDTAIENLQREGFAHKPAKVFQFGDVMQDSAELFSQRAISPHDFNVADGFILTTLHRPDNTGDLIRLSAIVEALNYLHNNVAPVVLPLHPRMRGALNEYGIILDVHLIEPVSYLEMLWLLKHCGIVLTDSGGVQKEAYFFGKACVSMNDHSVWVELVKAGVNKVVGADSKKIIEAVISNLGRVIEVDRNLYGGGVAAKKIVEQLKMIQLN